MVTHLRNYPVTKIYGKEPTIMELQKPSVRVDVSRIKARIKILEKEFRAGKNECKNAQRRYSKGGPPFFSHPKDYVFKEREQVTALYSLRAHFRGRLHMTKKDGKVWDMKNQESMITPYIAFYRITG